VAVDPDSGAPIEGVLGSPAPTEPVTLVFPRLPGSQRGAIARYFAALTLSVYGDWLTTVALVVVLFELTHNPAGPAGYVLARVAPRFLGPWLGGGLADRFDPRRTMAIASIFQAAVTASLILAHRDHAEWAIYAAVAVAQFAGALARPSQGSILPSLVSPERLMRANAGYSFLNSSSMFVAPAIGAAVLVFSGPDLLFAIDAATFVVAAALVLTLPSTPRAPAPPKRGRLNLGIGEGVRRGLAEPMIRMLAATMFAGGLVATVAQAFLVVAADQRFTGDHTVGYLYSAVGVGGLAGAVVSLRWRPRAANMRMVMVVGACIEVISLGGFSVSGSFALAVFFLGLSSAAGDCIINWGMTSIQLNAPEGYLGRFNAVFWLAQYLGMLLGAVFALASANALPWDRSIQVASVAVLAVVAAVGVLGGSMAPPRAAHPYDSLSLEDSWSSDPRRH
jgi:MFS family permease